MYLLNIGKDQMKKLYKLREYLKKKGRKATIVGLVREMIEDGLKRYDKMKDVKIEDINKF